MRGVVLVSGLMATVAGCKSYASEVRPARASAREAREDRQEAEARVRKLARALEEEDLYRARRERQLRAELASAPERPARRSVLAVMDLADPGGRLADGHGRLLADYLATAAVERTRHLVVPRGVLRAELRAEKAQSLEACVDEACQIELGKALAADHLLIPTVVAGEEDACLLGASLVELSTETAAWSTSVAASCRLEALVHAADTIADRLRDAGGEAARP